MIYRILVNTSIFLVIALCSCEMNKNPLDNQYFVNQNYIDSTKIYIDDGIYIELDGLKDVYTLDDTLKGHLYLINEDNKQGMWIYIGSWPPAGGYSIWDEQDNYLYFNVWVIGCAVFDYTLMPGDTLSENILWTQWFETPFSIYSGLKIFSGKYKLTGCFWGNEKLMDKYAVKWFEIKEQGDPISTKAHQYYESEDSIKVSFLIRNRISQAQQFLFMSEKKIEISYESHNDTVFKQVEYLDIQSDKIVIEPKSDILFYTYSISKNDPIISDFTGAYNLTIAIPFKERYIKASIKIYL